MLVRGLVALSQFAAGATAAVAVVLAVVLVVSLNLQIFFRYVVGEALTWSEELALFCFTWIVLLVGSLGVRQGFHARLTVVSGALPAAYRTNLQRLIDVLILVFGGFFAVAGYRYVDATLGHVSAAVQYPIEALHLAAPVSGALIALHAAARLADPTRPDPEDAPSAAGREDP